MKVLTASSDGKMPFLTAPENTFSAEFSAPVCKS